MIAGHNALLFLFGLWDIHDHCRHVVRIFYDFLCCLDQGFCRFRTLWWGIQNDLCHGIRAQCIMDPIGCHKDDIGIFHLSVKDFNLRVNDLSQSTGKFQPAIVDIIRFLVDFSFGEQLECLCMIMGNQIQLRIPLKDSRSDWLNIRRTTLHFPFGMLRGSGLHPAWLSV